MLLYINNYVPLYSVLCNNSCRLAREQNNALTETKGVIQMSSSQPKHYRGRDTYMQMTPYQREAYFPRSNNP